MALSIIKIGRQKSIATLAKSAFQLEKASPEEKVRAEAALLAANPQLATESGFKAGAEIIVPGVRGLGAADPDKLVERAASTLVALAADRAGALRDGHAILFKQAIEMARSDARELGGDAIAGLLKERPDLAKQVAAIREAANEDIKTLEQSASTVGAALEQLVADLGRVKGGTG